MVENTLQNAWSLPRFFSHIFTLTFYSLRYSNVICSTENDCVLVIVLILLFLFNKRTMMVCLLTISHTIPYFAPSETRITTKSSNLKVFFLRVTLEPNLWNELSVTLWLNRRQNSWWVLSALAIKDIMFGESVGSTSFCLAKEITKSSLFSDK